MGLFSPPKPPAMPMPPPAAHPQTMASSNIATEEEAMKQRAKAAEGMGMDNTIKTSPTGTKAPDTAKATLLGSS